MAYLPHFSTQNSFNRWYINHSFYANFSKNVVFKPQFCGLNFKLMKMVNISMAHKPPVKEAKIVKARDTMDVALYC